MILDIWSFADHLFLSIDFLMFYLFIYLFFCLYPLKVS